LIGLVKSNEDELWLICSSKIKIEYLLTMPLYNKILHKFLIYFSYNIFFSGATFAASEILSNAIHQFMAYLKCKCLGSKLRSIPAWICVWTNKSRYENS